MGAAPTYARRDALFALVGIAGEVDLDAPDILVEPSPKMDAPVGTSLGTRDRKLPNGTVHKPRQPRPVLTPGASAALRDQLVAEIQDLKHGDDLALWAHRRLPAKNTLRADDARAVEVAYQAVLDAANRDVQAQSVTIPIEPPAPKSHGSENGNPAANGAAAADTEPSTPRTVSPMSKEVRRRNKAHLAFVGAQPCLVCQRSPCDAHHLKFAQPRSLGRKVSDEFTVPLCRDHHRDLHRYGNEIAWWANLQIAPIEVARDLWQTTLLDPDVFDCSQDIAAASRGRNPGGGLGPARNQTGEVRRDDKQE
ncbi:MAG TPA: hypothetical protein VNR65_03965 [Geobacterales bacterium]|nr:hypothetical protein [Geobacterales bacterium]